MGNRYLVGDNSFAYKVVSNVNMFGTGVELIIVRESDGSEVVGKDRSGDSDVDSDFE